VPTLAWTSWASKSEKRKKTSTLETVEVAVEAAEVAEVEPVADATVPRLARETTDKVVTRAESLTSPPSPLCDESRCHRARL
jgi:hypothetical protein